MQANTVTHREQAGVTVYVLSNPAEQAEAHIVPALGNTCVAFRQVLRGETVDLIEPIPDLESVKQRASGFGNPILFPFPNRVREGRYTFEGETHEFAVKTALGNSIHGLVYTRPWVVESTSASEDGAQVVSRFDIDEFEGLSEQYPYPFELRVTYTLKGGRLLFEVDVQNMGETNMPMGFGIHPYFSAPLFETTAPEDCLVTIPASQSWVLDQFLPTGERVDVSGSLDLRAGKPFAGMKFDDVFTGVTETPSRCIIDDKAQRVRFVIESDGQFREIVVYTPPNRSAIAIEPYTCTTDAVNLQARGVDAGLIVLEPGNLFHGLIQMYAEEYD